MSHPLPARVVCLRSDDPELLRAQETFPDPVMEHPTLGGVLQYLCTAQAPDGTWYHEFRHRNHPATGRRRVWHIPAATGWVPSLNLGPEE